MSFDRLAPHYRWMEWLFAGRLLQRCRTAFLGCIEPPREVLLLGEGNGRFLEALLAAHPRARITYVDSSAAMLERARARVHAPTNVTFVHSDILRWSPTKRFDLIVSHFFLDCFQAEQIDRIVAATARAATADAQWLLADFCVPAAGLAHWRAQLILRSLYVFFRGMTGIRGSRITPPESYFPRQGFSLRQRVHFDWGLLHADWWSRNANPDRTESGVVFEYSEAGARLTI